MSTSNRLVVYSIGSSVNTYGHAGTRVEWETRERARSLVYNQENAHRSSKQFLLFFRLLIFGNRRRQTNDLLEERKTFKMMCILTGRAEGVRLLPAADYAIIGILTDSAKGKLSFKDINQVDSMIDLGMSTRSLPSTVHYTLEFETYDQIRGKPFKKDEPLFHYMQTGMAVPLINPKTRKVIPQPELKRPQIGQLYLALMNDPQQILQLIEIKEDDIDELRQVALQERKLPD